LPFRKKLSQNIIILHCKKFLLTKNANQMLKKKGKAAATTFRQLSRSIHPYKKSFIAKFQ